MRKMKKSGYSWIGYVPEEWKIAKIGSIFRERREKVSDKDYKPLSVTMKGILPQIEGVAKTDDSDNRKLVRINDFVINSRSDRRGSCGISEYNGSVSLINTVIFNKTDNLMDYFDKVFHTVLFASEFYRWGHGLVDDLWTTGWDDMKRIYLPLPPLSEQQSIVRYLDEKISKIDKIINANKSIIEKFEEYKKSVITKAVTQGLDDNVKFKDSGVKWIGKIPEGWQVIKIKHSSWLKGRIGWDGLQSSEYRDDGAYLITGTDFCNGRIDWNTCVHISDERFNEDKLLHVYENDLLITKDGTIGKVAIVKNCPEKVSLNSGVMIIRNISQLYKYNDRYMFYILQSGQFITWFDYCQTEASTIKHLYQNEFYDFIYTLPSLFTQEQIVLFLDDKCKKIDSEIKKKYDTNEKLEEYKKSLIWHAVTGKIDTRGVVK